MNRTMIGRAIMALGALFVVVGLIGLLTSGGDDDQQVAPASTSEASTSATSIAEPSTVAPTTAAPTSTTTATTTTATTTSTTTTTATTTSTTTTTTIAPEALETFLALFNDAFDSGDAGFLIGRLNEATIERYGFELCTTYLTGIVPQSQGLTLRRSVGVGPWDWVTDDITTSLGDVTALEVDRIVNGETRIQELHWQLVDGVFTWFTDCGEPLLID